MQNMNYFSKSFKSIIIKNFVKTGASHFPFEDEGPSIYNTCAVMYPDGVITAIHPKTGLLSISFDSGASWISGIVSAPIKNIKRVDKETFVFEIINGISPTIFAVTYDMFASYDIIPIGTDDDSVRMNCKNEIRYRAFAFVRNSLYVFDQDTRSYTKIMMFQTKYCSMHDSIDGQSTYLVIPSLSGYHVKKFYKDDRHDIAYNDFYSFVSSTAWIGAIIGFNIIKAHDNSDCFIITTEDFNTQIDIPSLNIFSNPETLVSENPIGFSYH